eukprot:TRINITY_DN2887_c0_g1_i3.p1 TRINITY_DN2887_c0_g1~~TRINITY_DN2887_c0_g1_i3.p1  ORF type:complete len:196 (+),score=47.55 TRINITY_DN2887_c0_g1_i3:268-855(+)
MADVTIVTPENYLGSILMLAQSRRAVQKDILSSDSKRLVITFEMPLSEIISDFNTDIKTLTSGYASLDYTEIGFKSSPLVKVDIGLNGETVEALSFIALRSKAETQSREIVGRLKEIIPRQLFAVAIQAIIGKKVVARESLSALRKDVTAKCYGGDITRKRKLLEKQKEGKKKMKTIGNVEIPPDTFRLVLQKKN